MKDVAVESFRKEVILDVANCVLRHLPRLSVVLPHPDQMLREVPEVVLEGYIVHPRLQLVVEVLVVVRVLLEDEGTPRKQVREAVSCNRPVNVDLVSVLYLVM